MVDSSCGLRHLHPHFLTSTYIYQINIKSNGIWRFVPLCRRDLISLLIIEIKLNQKIRARDGFQVLSIIETAEMNFAENCFTFYVNTISTLYLVVRRSKISMQINTLPLCCPHLNTGIVNLQTKQTQTLLHDLQIILFKVKFKVDIFVWKNHNQILFCFRPFYKQSFR